MMGNSDFVSYVRPIAISDGRMDDTFRSRYVNEVIVTCSAWGDHPHGLRSRGEERWRGSSLDWLKEMKGAKMKFVPFSFIIASFFGGAGIGGRGR